MNWNVRIAGGAALLFLVLFVRLGSLSLWDQDEAAYAGFGSRMIETGNWIIPEFPWSELHRKPPLHFWAIAASFAAFGINEFSLRLESAMSVFLLFVLIYHEGKKLWGKEVAFTSACVLGTSLLVPALGHVALTDGALLLFVTLSMLSWLQVMQDGPFHYVILFWLGFSLAVFIAREIEAGSVPGKLWRIVQAACFLLIGVGLLIVPWYLQVGTIAMIACVPSAIMALLAGFMSLRECRQTFFFAFCVKACFLIGV